jgi:sodium transport system permease protein
MSPWWIVFKKEIRETLRDRRTLQMMIAVPVLLYPVILIASEQILLFGRRSLEAERQPVAVLGDAPPELMRLIEARERIHVVPLEGDEDRAIEAIRANAVAAVIVLGPATGEDQTRSAMILFDAISDRSTRGRRELATAMDQWADTLLSQRLGERGLPASFARPVAVADSSVARPEEVGGYTLGRILPLLLVVITLLGTFYPAIDLAAGEKERGTLETLLTAPVPPASIVAGKFVTVALIGVLAAALNLGSMLMTFQTGVLQFVGSFGLDFQIPLGAVLIIFATLVPLAVLFGAICLGIAVHSSSFKEAQNALTPVYMLVLLPAMLPMFPGIDFKPSLALVPVAGVSFLFRDLMAGDADFVLGTLVLLSTVTYAAMALVFAAGAFGSEDVLFGAAGDDADVPTESLWTRVRKRSFRDRTPSVKAALTFVAAVAVLFFWMGVTLQVRYREVGVLLSEVLLLLVPALIFVRLGGYAPRETLSLRMPTGRAVAGALLMAAGATPLAWGIGWIQSFFLPIPWEMLEGFEELLTAETTSRLLWLILLLAVTPAICEEFVFRGVLLGGTRGMKTWQFVLLNGAIFGAFHLSFETVIRFLPTAWLGIVISWTVWRTRSLWMGSLMHVINNGSIVLLGTSPALKEKFSDPNTPLPVWIFPLAAVSLWAGTRVLSKLRPARGADDLAALWEEE